MQFVQQACICSTNRAKTRTLLMYILNAAGLKVYAAMIDAELNDKGYIVPGLGDDGDRAYGTL